MASRVVPSWLTKIALGAAVKNPSNLFYNGLRPRRFRVIEDEAVPAAVGGKGLEGSLAPLPGRVSSSTLGQNR